MVRRGPFVLEVPGHSFVFVVNDIGGPFVLGKGGLPLATQPGGRSLFWEAYSHWNRQGRQVDDQGRCIFKWEAAPIHVTKQLGGLPLAPTTPSAPPEVITAPPGKTAKVTISSTPPEAEIFVNGKFVGNAPAGLTLAVGKYEFRVVLSGHEEWIRELELIPDSDHRLAAHLAKSAKQQGENP
jgi:hypothetical protein